MNVDRSKLGSLVKVFYQPPFKLFYVNSIDSVRFMKPLGIFISLGITSSMKVLEDLKNILVNTGYSAKIVEISSTKNNGSFLNTITKMSNPKQFELTEFPENTLDKEMAEQKLEEMRSLMSTDQQLSVLQEYAPKISKLQDLIEKLTSTNGWDAHLIQMNEGNEDFRIFHKYVNYMKKDKIELRIGIYVDKELGL